MTSITTLRVAVVGAGPAGIYAADALTRQQDVPVAVDVLDRLPTPFGLVRYGVAPDHLKIKSISAALQQVLDRDNVRFLGNVRIGPAADEVSADRVRAAYHAVIWSYGAATDRRLGIPGEELAGSVAATDLVKWYCGHPDPAPVDFAGLIGSATQAVVVGVGNVAVDVARILVKPSEALRATDMPDGVLQALDASAVTDVHLLGRRGPAQAKWTTKELRELGELDGVDLVVDPHDLVARDGDDEDAADAAVTRNVATVAAWAGRQQRGARRRIHLHFWSRPGELLGADGRVTGVVVERTTRDAQGQTVGTGETSMLAAQLVVRSVGYRGTPLSGLPFDVGSATVPHVAGRVLGGAPGDYVAGWIKRGPTGVIGSNRSDASETVRTLLADAPALLARGETCPEQLWDDERARGRRLVERDHWLAIDAAEIALGQAASRGRVKLHALELLLAAAHPLS